MNENASSVRMSPRFRAGLVLLIANVPVGYGGLAVAGGIAAWTGEPRWLLAGAACYALSWMMLLAGIALSGRDGVAYAKSLWMRFRRREPCPRVRTPSGDR